MNTSDLFRKNRDLVTYECTLALKAIDSDIINIYVETVINAEKVFFIGVGRVLLSLKAICKRYSHIGIDSYVVGDITEPAMTEDDVLIVGSGSGNTVIPLEIAKMAKKIGAKVIHIGSNPNGEIEEYTDFFVRIPVSSKMHHADEINSLQPMTTLFEQALLLFGDITVMVMIEVLDINIKELWKYHANLE